MKVQSHPNTEKHIALVAVLNKKYKPKVQTFSLEFKTPK